MLLLPHFHSAAKSLLQFGDGSSSADVSMVKSQLLWPSHTLATCAVALPTLALQLRPYVPETILMAIASAGAGALAAGRGSARLGALEERECQFARPGPATN